MTPTASRAAIFIVLAAIAAVASVIGWQRREVPTSREAPHFVGREVCARCHAAEARAWRGSHHDLAMQEASEATVLGNFSGTTFDDGAVTSRFFRDGKRFVVNTDGPDGRLADFEVRYTFGATPLQQYLVALPGGRLQALPIAWDTRDVAQGGQRWFHLYGDEPIRFDDPLHWTGLQQNWNYMCAECHSTHLEKHYDAKTRTYATTWAEIDVSCEACHGPASTHVTWAHEGASSDIARRGLAVQLDERGGVTWRWDATALKPVRSSPRTTQRELDACAQCHSRRGAIWPYEHGGPIGDTHRVALLDEPLYYPDGQIRDEVYEYGSFLQSKMHMAGVTCSDCHEPHSAALRAPGNAVCTQCHLASRYDAATHHHHAAQSTGSACVGCHMPERTYMVVDTRRDHSLRVPNPEQSLALGTPDPCTGCHVDRDQAWAAAQLRDWPAPAGRVDGQSDSSVAVPPIRRATTIVQTRIANREELAALRAALDDTDPLVRRAAVAAYEMVLPEYREDAFIALADPVRDVRLQAVPLLAAIPIDALSPEQQARLDTAKAEYIASQRVDADRPEAHLNLGLLAARTGDAVTAEAELREALTIDPRFVPATVNLADLYRSLGRERDAEVLLRGAIEISGDVASLRHSLGLLLVRTQRADAALAELARAHELEPNAARYAFVYAVALADAGRKLEAITLLERTLAAHPDDPDVRAALDAYRNREAMN